MFFLGINMRYIDKKVLTFFFISIAESVLFVSAGLGSREKAERSDARV